MPPGVGRSLMRCLTGTMNEAGRGLDGLGRLDDQDVVRLNQAVMGFLGLAVSSRASSKGE